MTVESKVGWLFGYSYLWADQYGRGREEGVKDRPCALVATVREKLLSHAQAGRLGRVRRSE